MAMTKNDLRLKKKAKELADYCATCPELPSFFRPEQRAERAITSLLKALLRENVSSWTAESLEYDDHDELYYCKVRECGLEVEGIRGKFAVTVEINPKAEDIRDEIIKAVTIKATLQRLYLDQQDAKAQARRAARGES